jgi:hypothetical protein
MLALVPACAFGQAASEGEQAAVLEIARCITQGPPEDWGRLTMEVRLEQPGAETGEVRYFATRESAPEQRVAYMPCDPSVPAKILLAARREQDPAKRGWTGARLTLTRDGKFGIVYDYP